MTRFRPQKREIGGSIRRRKDYTFPRPNRCRCTKDLRRRYREPFQGIPMLKKGEKSRTSPHHFHDLPLLRLLYRYVDEEEDDDAEKFDDHQYDGDAVEYR